MRGRELWESFHIGLGEVGEGGVYLVSMMENTEDENESFDGNRRRKSW